MPRIEEALPIGPAHAGPGRQIHSVRKADLDVRSRALQHLEHLPLHAPELLAGGVRVVERGPLCASWQMEAREGRLVGELALAYADWLMQLLHYYYALS